MARLDRSDQDFARFRAHGDTRALARVFDELAPELLLVAAHLAPRGCEAEDLVQATFVDAIRHAQRWDPARRLMPWLLGILTHQVSGARKRARPSTGLERLDPSKEPSLERGPADAAQEREFGEAFAQALGALAPHYKQVLTLRLVHGLGPGEIARALVCPVATVKTRLQRGLQALRDALPIGFAVGGAGLALLAPPRALAQVRAAVFEAAGIAMPAGTALGLLGGALLMKKTVLAAGAAGILVCAWLGHSLLPGWSGTSGERPAAAALDAAAREKHADSSPQEAAPTTLRTEVAAETTGTGSVAIELVWQEDGAPAPFVTINDEFGNQCFRHWSGADGRLELFALAAGEHRIWGANSAWSDVRIRPGEHAEVRLEVAGRVLVTGLVVGPDARPIAGASVWACQKYVALELTQRKIATTGADGTFRARAVDLDTLWARKAGMQPSATLAFDTARDSGRAITLHMQGPAGSVRGQVLDPRGAPVADALVALTIDERLNQPRATEDGAELRHAEPLVLRSDERGAFASDELPPGKRSAWARAPGFAFGTSLVAVRAGEVASCTITLRRGATVLGRARDAAGKPVQNLEVRAFPASGALGLGSASFALERSTATGDSEGRYRMVGVAPEPMNLAARGDGMRDARRTVELQDGQELEWNLTDPGDLQIRGRLLDPAGKPVVGWLVCADHEPGGAEQIPEIHGSLHQCAMTDGEGRFAMSHLVDLPYVVAARPDPVFVLLCWALVDGVRPSAADVVLRLTDDPDRPCVLEGRLVPDRHAPLPKAIVNVRRNGAPPGHWSETSNSVENADGFFSIASLPPGSYSIAIQPERRGPIDAGTRDLRAGETCDLGDLRLDLQSRVCVRLVDERGKSADASELVLEGTAGSWSTFTKAPDGTRRSIPLSAGTFELSAWGTSFVPVRRPVRIDAGHDTEVEIAVAPAREVRFELVAPSVGGHDQKRERWSDTMSVRISDAAGTLLLERIVPIEVEGDRFSWARALGSGAFRLKAHAYGSKLEGEATVTVPAGGGEPVRVEIPLRPSR